MDVVLSEYLSCDEEVGVAIAHISNSFQEGFLFVDNSQKNLIPPHEEEEKIRRGLDKIAYEPLKAPGFIHVEGSRYYLMKAWKLEQEVDFHFERLAKAAPFHKIEEARAKNFVYDLQQQGKLFDDQAEAILGAILNCVFCIWGGPGTGKSYTARCFLEIFLKVLEPQNVRVVLAAPTGKASRLLARGISIKGVDVKTLHSLLEIRPSGKMPKKTEALPYDLFIIDESSMMDSSLCKKLLGRIADGSRVLFLGDPCQLPPVEPGMPFVSFIEKQMHKGALTTCRRTELVPILDLASAINRSEPDKVLTLLKNNPEVLSWKPLDESTLSSLIEEHVKQLYNDSSPPQILSALRVGKFGTIEVNERVYKEAVRYATWQKRALFEPIVITKNDYRLGLYNGDLGVFLAKDHVQFSSLEESIPRVLLGSYEHAYCLSVHKSQGSEFESVVILLPPGSERFSKKMLYTAVTRAKKRLTILATEETLTNASFV